MYTLKFQNNSWRCFFNAEESPMSQKRAFRLFRYYAGMANVRVTLYDYLEPERALARVFLCDTASLPVIPTIQFDNEGNFTLLFNSSIKSK